MPHPRRDRTTEIRWQRWQATLISQRMVPRVAAHDGFTVLQVPPESRAAFFACVELLAAQTQCAHASDPVLQRLCDAWTRWSQRLAAYLVRRARGKPGTLPALPEPLRSLLKASEVSDAP